MNNFFIILIGFLILYAGIDTINGKPLSLKLCLVSVLFTLASFKKVFINFQELHSAKGKLSRVCTIV